MSEVATKVCDVCLGTGWDEVFDSACGECGADLATDEQVVAAQAKLDEAKAEFDRVFGERERLVEWLGQQDWEFPQSLAAQYGKKGDLSAKQWAAAERLYAKAQDPAPRWVKVGERWGVRAPGRQVGDTVTVTNRAKETSEVYLFSVIEDDVFAVGDKPGTFRADAPGMYITADERIVKAKQSGNTGRLYGKVLTDEGRFEYDPKVIREVVRKLTLEEAKAYGQRTGVCCVCGRELTNEASIEAGIGPICSSRL